MMQENATALEDAVLTDLGRQRLETASFEIGPILQEALRAAENLEEWTKPAKPNVDEWRGNWDTTIFPVPKGLALIIS